MVPQASTFLPCIAYVEILPIEVDYACMHAVYVSCEPIGYNAKVSTSSGIEWRREKLGFWLIM